MWGNIPLFLNGNSDYVPINCDYKKALQITETSDPITGNKRIQETIREQVYVKKQPIVMVGDKKYIADEQSDGHTWVVDGWQLWETKGLQDMTGQSAMKEIKLYCNFGDGNNYLCDYGLFKNNKPEATAYVQGFGVVPYSFF